MSADAPKTYSLLNTTLFFGSLLPGGFGEGDAITIDPNGDAWVATVGADGSVAFAETGDDLFIVKVNLLHTSPTNAIMSAIYQAQRATKIALPFFYKDNGGADVFKSSAAMIQKLPPVKRGSKVSTQEWPILCAKGVLLLGGN